MPGTRAPHVELEQNGTSISTLDLFGTNFVLLTGHEGGAWRQPVTAAGKKIGIDIECHLVERAATQGKLVDLHGDHATPFCTHYGIEPSGAVLVRPDGYVAWRAKTYSAAQADRFGQVLNSVLSRAKTEVAVAA